MQRISHWLDGEPSTGNSVRVGSVTNPAAGEQVADVAFADAAEVAAAVESAHAAWLGWRDTSMAHRTKILFAFRDVLQERREAICEAITTEHGKDLADAAGEIARGLEVVEFACGLAQLTKGEWSAQASTGVDVHSVRAPLGVAAVISPFNFPAMVPLWFAPIAIACGNTVALKPSERVPSAANLLAQCWAAAGLPAGAFNVVHGDQPTAEALITHPLVRSVSFVGSTLVARHVYGLAAAHGKRVQALGGAKNHMIVLPDADLDAAADAAVSAGYGSSGERCMAISVVAAAEPIADRLVDLIAQRTRSLSVGDGRRGCSMGPLITAAHRDRVTRLIAEGVEAGAELVIDGRGVEADGGPNGFWLGPTLFDRVTTSMSVYTEEIFGPVLGVVRIESLEQGVELINTNRYGNGAALFTRDGRAARQFERDAEAGMIGINVPIPVPVAQHSFGGWSESLFGDLNAYGPDGVRFFTRNKVITSRWPAPSPAGPTLSFPRNS